jgi:membrane protein implicated in regulation of membrane protease activity
VPKPFWFRLLMSVGAGVAFGVLVAISLTILDIYLAGHGRPTLGAPLLDVDSLGVHLSLNDVLFLVAAVTAAMFTWRAMGKNAV